MKPESVEMIEAVKKFTIAVNRQEHLSPLLKLADLQVSLVSNGQTIDLTFKNGEIHLAE